MRYAKACEWLGLDPTIKLDEATLCKAFRTVARREHPDKSDHEDATKRFQEISHANQYLLTCIARDETGLNAYEEDDDEEEDFVYDDGYDEDFDVMMSFFFSRVPLGVIFGPDGEIYISIPCSHEMPPRSPSGALKDDFFHNSRRSSSREVDYDDDSKPAAAAASPSYYNNMYHDDIRTQEERKEEEENLRKQKKKQEKEERRKKEKKEKKERKRQEKEYNAFVERMEKEKVQTYEEFMKRLSSCAAEKEKARKRQKQREQERASQGTNNNGDNSTPHLELKKRAPLLLEFARVSNTNNQDLNGRKVRVVDFYDGMYVVEWDAEGGSMPPSKGKGSARSRKARIKPGHLQLWGTPTTEEVQSSPPELDSNATNATKLNNDDAAAAAVPPAQPKLIKIKIKCPNDKKPGDILEVKNPHDPGKKVKVRIPPKAKPGKTFEWMVPVAQQKQKKIICAVCARDITNDSTKVPLRSCVHTTCQSCAKIVEGKCCLACNKPKPTVESLEPFPYLQELHAPKSLLAKMLEEFLCSREHEAADATVAGKAKEKLDKAAEEVESELKRHYRKMSLKLHPDRKGEEYRPQFDSLTKARDVLMQSSLRRSYVDNMMDIVCRVDVNYLPRSHKYWMEKNASKIIDETTDGPTRRKQEAGKKEKLFQLEGGLLYSTPKKPRVHIQNYKERLIEAGLPITNEYQFRNYCHAVIIVGSCMEHDENIRLGEMTMKDNNILINNDGEISAKLFLPSPAVWEIKWYMEVRGVDDKVFETPFSAEATVDVRSREQLAMLEQLGTMKQSARRRELAIRNMLKGLKNASNGRLAAREEVEARYWEMHSVIANGRFLERRMKATMKKANEEEAPTELKALHEVVEEALKEKVKLEELYEHYLQKDAKRNFKQKVAGILERGDGPYWIKNLVEEDLEQGSANRLYQLLIEGKKAQSLVLDGEILFAAAERTDLFSDKQCTVLRERGEEIEEHAKREEARLAEETQKAIQAEQERQEMQAMATLMPRGSLVKIHDLANGNKLNGNIGTFIGVAPNKRYCIRLYGGREISLKECNFSAWDESQFGTETNTIEKENSPPSRPKKNAPASNNKKAAASKQGGANHNIGSQNNVKKSQMSNAATAVRPKNAHNGASNPIQNKSSKQPPAVTVNANLNVNSNKKATTNVMENSSHTKGSKHNKSNRASETVTTDVSRTSSSNISTKSNNNKSAEDQSRTSSSKQTNAKNQNPKFCNMRGNCRFLAQGPGVCRFFHPPEEIARIHPGLPLEVTVDGASIAGEEEEHQTLTTASEHEQGPHSDEVLQFLTKEKGCLKCKPVVFHRWLQSEEINTLEDLSEAVEDDEYLEKDMVKNGLKKFKRGPFRKAVRIGAASLG